MPWCKVCDKGLIAPDCIIYLDISVEEASKRGNFGEERYEKIDFQNKIREKFMQLKQEDEESKNDHVPVPNWHVLDATKSIEEVHKEIVSIVDSTITNISETETKKLWL